MKSVAAILGLIGGVAIAVHAQAQAPRESPTSGSSAITVSGRVIADSTGDPIPNARVTVTGTQQTAPVVLTDRDGRFSVAAPAGRFNVTASKTGYARRESTPPTAGEAIEVRLRRSAAISGRVLDEFGEPVSGVRVAGQTRQGSAPDASAVALGVSDDNGEYRLAGLPAGSFIVVVTTARAVTPQQSASSQSSFSSSLQRTYYPGVTTPAEAQALSLRPGDDRSGIDFVVAAPVFQSRPFSVLMPAAQRSDVRASGVVRGRVVSADGRSLPRVQVALSGTGLAGVFSSAATTTDDDGRFELREIGPGRFVISASKAG